MFHADWEKRAFALTLAMAHAGRLEHRHVALRARKPPPAEYLSMSYYQIWFAGAGNHAEGTRRWSREDEIAAGHALHQRKPVTRVLSPDDVLKVLHRGGPTERETNTRRALRGRRPRAGEEHASA